MVPGTSVFLQSALRLEDSNPSGGGKVTWRLKCRSWSGHCDHQYMSLRAVTSSVNKTVDLGLRGIGRAQKEVVECPRKAGTGSTKRFPAIDETDGVE
jgi:hypothetical protein